MRSPLGFLKNNPWKKETLLTYYYSAFFRMQLLCLPPGTVRSRLAQIRRHLKTELSEE